MTTQEDISREYGSRAFRTQEAQRLGITRGALANPKLWRPFTGVRAAGNRGHTLRERALAFLPLMRLGERFSHKTALALLACPIYVDEDAPIDVESAPGVYPSRRRGVLGHRATPGAPTFWLRIPEHEDPELWSLGPIPLSMPLNAALQAATQLPFQEIVVALDHLLSKNVPHFDSSVRIRSAELTAATEEFRGRRGFVRFLAATKMAKVGGDSRMETLTRLIGERAGVRNLELQLEVQHPSGKLIGRFDMADITSKSLFEYDGEQRRTKTWQYRRDLIRLDEARDAGWRPLRFHHEDILDMPEETGRRMLAHIKRAPARVSKHLSRLLDERAEGRTVSAQPKKVSPSPKPPRERSLTGFRSRNTCKTALSKDC